MSLAIIELIAVELETRLLAMVGDSTTYPTDVQEVKRPNRFANYTPIDRQIIITQGVQNEVPELSCPGNPPAVALAQQFNIRLVMMPSERSQDAIDTLLVALPDTVLVEVINAPQLLSLGAQGTVMSTEISVSMQMKEG